MRKKILPWIGIIISGVLGLLVLAAVGLYLVGSARNNKKYTVPVEQVSIPADAQSLQRGKHLATILICTRCHMEDFSGTVTFEIPGMLTIPTPNLTAGAGGVGAVYTDEDWVRAIRHGVAKDQRALMIMPSKTFHRLSDEDLGAVIAYIKSLTPVDHPLPERKIGLVFQVMSGTGMVPPYSAEQIDHASPPPAAPPSGVTADYGEYLAQTCTECHGARLNGAPFGPPGQQVLTPNLTPSGTPADWSESDFIHTMRSGVTPDGRPLNKEMPWEYYGQMTDDELRALWMYLRSLPALAHGG